MQSALIVHSKHTKYYAKWLSNKYRDVTFLEVTRPPTKGILKIKNNKDVVVGIGGGSVIDTAKIISKDRRCIAIPTTAAGASMTPYATVGRARDDGNHFGLAAGLGPAPSGGAGAAAW